jgi:hypothetical protein
MRAMSTRSTPTPTITRRSPAGAQHVQRLPPRPAAGAREHEEGAVGTRSSSVHATSSAAPSAAPRQTRRPVRS